MAVLPGLKDILEKTSFVVICLFLIVFGLFQGVQIQSFTLDLFFIALEVLWIDAVFSSLGFAGFFLISALIFFIKLVSWSDIEADGDFGSVTCVIPCYMDSEALKRSVKSLANSKYQNLEIKVIVEEDDEESIREAESLAESFNNTGFLINDRYPGSKAGALNYAAEETSSDYIGFFDADQVVKPDFISQAAKLLQNYQIVMGRNLPKPDGFVESLSYYESIFFTYVSRQLLSIFTGFSLVGSRSILMRRTVFEELNGYKDDTLTEDYDFAHRCYLNHIDIINIPVPVENLSAHNFRDWWGQRKRWMTGFFQVLSKLMKNLLTDFKGRRSIFSVLICGGSLLGSFLMLTIVSKFVILLLAGARIVYVVPVLSLIFIAFVFRYHDKKYNFVENIGYSWLVVPLIFPFFSLITIKSFIEFLFNSTSSWYRVEK